MFKIIIKFKQIITDCTISTYKYNNFVFVFFKLYIFISSGISKRQQWNVYLYASMFVLIVFLTSKNWFMIVQKERFESSDIFFFNITH